MEFLFVFLCASDGPGAERVSPITSEVAIDVSRWSAFNSCVSFSQEDPQVVGTPLPFVLLVFGESALTLPLN